MNPSTRLDYRSLAPDAVDALAGVDRCLDGCALAPALRLLVEIRVSQINGCAYCVDLHTRRARAAGERSQRIDCLGVWREVPLFDARERAAPARAEALTRSADAPPDAAVYADALDRFGEKEFVDLTLGVAGMNAGNRIGVGLRPAVRER
ncbi:MAG TPA: carboxymuconolactone decarboxylase family protein [Dokdonella sp.]